MDGVPIGKMARMKERYRERDRKKSTEARAGGRRTHCPNGGKGVWTLPPNGWQ